MIRNLDAPGMLSAMTGRRGFGLIDVSLGIIAGITTLVGAVVLYQQASLSQEVSETSLSALALSSEVRVVARNAARFSDITGNEDSGYTVIDLTNFSLDTLIERNLRLRAPLSGPDVFHLQVIGISRRACDRLSMNFRTLGTRLVSADCLPTGAPGGAPMLEAIYAR